MLSPSSDQAATTDQRLPSAVDLDGINHHQDDADIDDSDEADIDAGQPSPPPAAALLDDVDVDKCSRADLLAMLRDLLADRVRLLRRHSRTVDQLSGRLRRRADELQSVRLAVESVGRENADLRRLLAGVESERLRLMDTGRQWQALAGQSGAALANDLAGLRHKVASLERLLNQLGDSSRRLPADGQEAATPAVAQPDATERRLVEIESSLSSFRPAEALMLRHLVTLARQKIGDNAAASAGMSATNMQPS